MGNTNIKDNDVIMKDVNDIDELVNNIKTISNTLLDTYKKDFLNKDFCNKVDIVYRDKLSGLSINSLEKINNTINGRESKENKESKESNKKIDIFLKYEPAFEDRFVINELKEELVDLFRNRVLNSDTEIKYINKNMNTNVSKKYNGGYVSNRVSHIGGDQNYNSNRVKKQILELIDEEKKQNNKTNEKNKTNETDKTNKTNENNKNEVSYNFLKNIEEIEKEIKNTKGSKKGRNIKKNIEIEKKKEKEIIQNFKKDKYIQSNIQSNNRPNIKSNIQSNIQSNIRPNIQSNIKNNNINDKQSMYIFPKCNNKTEKCELTKSELCKAISQHYIIRSNIIATILSALSQNGKDGYCGSRLKSLESFKICLPPNTKDKNIDELSRYINNFDNKSCINVNGYYKVLNEKERNIFMKSDNEFNIFYKRYVKKLNNDYKVSLNSLIEVLEVLKNEKSINNKTLNEISRKTKEIIDDLYKKCQLNYIYAIIAFINADISTTEEMISERRKIIDKLSKNNF